MGSFIDDFMGSLGGDVSKQLSSTLNLDQNQVEKMIPAVAPLILGGLKKQKDEHGGADRVDHILNKYGSASVLDNLGDLFRVRRVIKIRIRIWVDCWPVRETRLQICYRNNLIWMAAQQIS